jgi:hypothetical protein
MFEVDDTWQTRGGEVFQAVFSQPWRRRYRLVELSLNAQLFHVDIHASIGDEIFCARFIFNSGADVLDIILPLCASTVRVSLQSCRRDLEDYSICTVEEIFESIEHAGAYFYRCNNGVVRSDSFHDISFDGGAVKSIWKSW